MKKTIVIVLAFLFSSFSMAQTVAGKGYRVYSGSMIIGSASIPLKITVDPDLETVTFGDPEIPNHGFVNHQLKLDISEGTQVCSRDLLVNQGDGNLSQSNIDICSGLVLTVLHPEQLLSLAKVQANIALKSQDSVIAKVELKFDSIVTLNSDPDRSN